MGKKRKIKYAKPQFKAGDAATKGGDVYTVAECVDRKTGNRPYYRLVGKVGLYPEQHLKEIE